MLLVLAVGITREGWTLLLISVFLLLMTLRGIGTGTATLFFRDVTRSEDGYLYWIAIGMGLVVGTACLVSFIVTLFDPQYLPGRSR